MRVRSSFAVCVIDQVSPWFTPSSTVAATIQFQLGAESTIMNGIGSAASQPSSSTCLRPMRSDSRPATKLSTPLTKPKATTKAISSMNDPSGHAEFGFGERRHDRAHHADGEPDQQHLQQLVQELVEVVADAVA